MAPRKGLRARTQVPGTPENESSSGSSLSRPPSSGDHSPSPAPSRRPPPPLPSRPPPRTPLLQDRNPANSAPAPINLGLTNAQKTRLFEIEMEKSEHQMRQAAAAADQAERLQQVAEEKALLEIEYMRKEGDAHLAALNARREPATQGTHERGRNDEDDDSIGETTPPEVAARRDMFSGLPEEEIVKIFKNKFKPMNLYKLRHLHGFEDTWEEDSIVIENGSLKPRKSTGTYKDFGKSIHEVWSEAFLNYMLVINILFGTPELSAALLLFYRQIMTLA